MLVIILHKECEFDLGTEVDEDDDKGEKANVLYDD
jgi:hypothetical protein